MTKSFWTCFSGEKIFLSNQLAMVLNPFESSMWCIVHSLSQIVQVPTKNSTNYIYIYLTICVCVCARFFNTLMTLEVCFCAGPRIVHASALTKLKIHCGKFVLPYVLERKRVWSSSDFFAMYIANLPRNRLAKESLNWNLVAKHPFANFVPFGIRKSMNFVVSRARISRRR